MLTSRNGRHFTDLDQSLNLNSNTENKNSFQHWQSNCLWVYHREPDKDEQTTYQEWENRFYEQVYQQGTENTYISSFDKYNEQDDQTAEESEKDLKKLNINHYTPSLFCWNCHKEFWSNNRLHKHVCRDCISAVNHRSIEGSLTCSTIVSSNQLKQPMKEYTFWG